MTTNETLTLVIASLALIVSLTQLIYYGKEIKIIKKQYEEERAEKEKNILTITAQHSNQYGGISDDPLKWLGIWLKVNNRSDEQPLLSEVDVELHFTDNYKKRKEAKFILFDLIKFAFEKPRKIVYSFSMYKSGQSYSGDFSEIPISGGLYDFPRDFYLIDLETKAPILFAAQKEFRMQGPNIKKQWLFFGIIPDGVGNLFLKAGFSLEKVQLTFYTDQGEITILKKMYTYLLSRKLLDEYLSYKFDHEY